MHGHAQALQYLPAPSGMDAMAQRGGHPGGRFGPGPDAPIGRRVLEGGGERGTLAGGEQPHAAGILGPTVLEPGWAMLIVALGNRAHPVDCVAGHRRDLGGGHPPGPQPHHLPGAAGDGVVGSPVPALQCLDSKVWLNRKVSGQTYILYQDLV
jgi:hypothetical protein